MLCKKFKNYLELIRFFNPTGTLLLLYPIIITFLWLEPSEGSFGFLIYFVLGTFLMRSSGCIVNDLCDVRFDKNVLRTRNRPLASGAVSKFEAIILLLCLLLFSLGILLQFNSAAILFGISLIIPISIYPLTKRFFRYPQLFLGMTFNLGVFLLWLALFYDVSIVSFIFYISFVLWTIGYDTVYAYQDIEDDMGLGLHSTAISFGKYSRLIIMICYVSFFVLLLALGVMKGYGFAYFILINLLAMYVVARISFLDLSDKQDCFRFFKFNNVIGVVLVVLYLAGNVLYIGSS